MLLQREEQQLDSNNQLIDLSQYNNGIYLISIEANGHRYHKKVVLEKF